MRRELTDRPSITLPLCVLGAGLVHGICIAALLPMLITVPAPVESSGGPHPADVAANKAEAARPARPAADQAPLLVTGSLAAPAARTNLLAKLPREELHPAAPVAVRLASADVADIVLADTDPVVAGALTAALEEIETRGAPADFIEVIEEETPEAVAHAEPAPPPSQSVQPKASAPPQKARAVQPRPRAKARSTAATAARRPAAVPARPSTGPIARRPVQPRVRTAPPNLGLGLLFSRPARRQAVSR
jgi:hypothetical protein